MNLYVSDTHLMQMIGANWGENSATDVGAAVLNYLYGDKDRVVDRERALGHFLIGILADQVRRNR